MKEGRPRNLDSPEQLWGLFESYKESLKEESKKWEKIQYVGKDGVKKTDYPKLPMILKGFYTFCHYQVGCVKQYFLNEGEAYNDFLTITARIKDEIESDQVTGALLGNYNSNLTARINGLKEQSEVVTTSVSILNIDPLDDSADNSTKKDSES